MSMMNLPSLKLFIVLFSLLNIAFSDCVSPKVHLQILRTYKDTASEEVMEIYQGTPLQGSLEFTADGVGNDNKEVTYDLCLSPEIHTFVALDGNNDGWKDGSYFVLKTYAGVILLKGTLEYYRRKEWTFYPAYTVSFGSQWKYTSEPQSGNSWRSQSYDDSAWSTYTAGHFPRYNQITRYYRYNGVFPAEIKEFPIAEVGIYSKEGVIVYINGIEVYRNNIDSPFPTSSTPATRCDNNYLLKRQDSFILTPLYDAHEVVIAVEIHSMESLLPSDDSFDMYFIPIYGPCTTRSHDGTINASSADPSYPATNAFDSDIHTLWQFNTLPATLDYTFPENKVEWINSYTIYTGTQNKNYDAASWKFQASNDGMTFILLDYKTDVQFDVLSSYRTFNLPSNTIAYRYYRFTILSTFGSSEHNAIGQIGEIFLNSCLGPVMPSYTLSYPSQTYTFVTNMSEVFIAPYSTGFTSFSANKDLPEGLHLNSNSGVLYGVPTRAFSSQYIQISALSSMSLTSTTTLLLTVVDCVSPNIRMDIHKYNSNKGVGAIETFSLYNSTSLLDTQTGLFSLHQDLYIQTYKYCLPQTDYQLVLSSSETTGWARGSSIEVVLPTYANYTLLRTSLLETHNQTVSFQTVFMAPQHTTIYTTAGTLPSTDWTTSTDSLPSFVDYDPSTSSLTSPSSLWYFRSFYSSTIPEGVQGFEIRFMARAGSIFYINGQEVYRAHLDAQTVLTPTTVAPTGRSYNESPVPFVFTGTVHTLRTGLTSNQLLLAYVLVSTAGYQPSLVDTTITLRYLYETQMVSRTWAMDTQESNAVDPTTKGDNAFDHNYSTRFIGYLNDQYPSPQWVTGHYQQERAEVVNSYCVVNGYDHAQYDPLTFVLEGSHDGMEYIELDREQNIVWDSRNQRHCYYLYSQHTAYQYYRFSILKIDSSSQNDRFGIAQIEFYIYDYDTIQLPPLSYAYSTVEGYVGANFISTYPNSEYWTQFNIQPALPRGLSIDTGTGILSGIPTDTLMETYNITALGPHGLSSCSLTIRILRCTVPKGLLTIEFEGMGEYSYQNGFELRDHNNILKYTYPHFPGYLEHWSFNYCIESNIYNLVLLDSRGDGWNHGKYIVYGEEKNVLVKGTVVYGEKRKTVRFNTAYLVYSDTNRWSYLQNGQIAPSDWTSKSFDASSWATDKSDNFSKLSGTTQYYRTVFTAPFLQKYSKWEMRVCYTYGIRVYLNGQEIYSYHLPDTVTSETFATDAFQDQTCVSMYGSTQFSSLVQGSNVLAIELHTYQSPLGSLLLDEHMMCSFKLHVDLYEGVFDGSVTTSHPGYKDDYYDQSELNAFDAAIGTKYYGVSTCVDQYVQYNYHYGKADYINGWSFVRGDVDEHVPTDLTLLGSADNKTWTPLHWRTNLVFGASMTPEATKKFSFYNERAYSYYRVVMNGNCLGGFEASEIQFYTTIIEQYCEARDGYARQVYGEYSYQSCGEAYTGYKSRYCNQEGVFEPEVNNCKIRAPQKFYYSQTSYVGSSMSIFTTSKPVIVAAEYELSVTPDLPTGLYLNGKNGDISGIPIAVTPETEYTIRIKNSKGMLETTITIRIDEATPIAIFVWLIILLVLITLIVILCVIFNQRRENANKRRRAAKEQQQQLTKSLV